MKQCVLLVDHGSRRAEANQTTEALAKQLEATLGQRVLATHMELAEPEYAATLVELAEDRELTSLTVLPLFFVEGKHWREDTVLAIMTALETAFQDNTDFPRMRLS